MEIKLGPYKISKRTPYSKIRIFDVIANRDITDMYEDMAEKIYDDYVKQTENPEKYFNIKNDVLFNVNGDEIQNIENIFVPNGITTIAKSAFCDNPFLRIELPDSLLSIEDYTFAGCKNLTEIYIPDLVSCIGYCAFSECCNLNTVILPNKLRYLSGRAFACCYNLESITLPDSLDTIESLTFDDCYNLKHIDLPKNLKNINNMTFRNCMSLESVNLPDSMVSICDGAFEGCAKLKELVIPDSVTRLYKKTFSGCISLESIKLPENILLIPNELFSGCTNLKNIHIPDSVVGIGQSAFKHTAIKNIDIPNNFNHTDLFPFEESDIESLTINHDLKKFTALNFDLISASRIHKLIINKNVRTINSDAFSYAGSKITEIKYCGTAKEFERFREENPGLFEILSDIKNIDCTEQEQPVHISDEVFKYDGDEILK